MYRRELQRTTSDLAEIQSVIGAGILSGIQMLVSTFLRSEHESTQALTLHTGLQALRENMKHLRKPENAFPKLSWERLKLLRFLNFGPAPHI